MQKLSGNVSIISIGGPSHPSQANVWWMATEPLINPRTFRVYRSGTYTPGTDYTEQPEMLTEFEGLPGSMNWTFSDISLDLRDTFRQYYYKIEMLYHDAVEYVLDWFTWDSQLQVHEFEMLRIHEVLFHYDSGSPVILYSARTDNPLRCPSCWDVTMNQARPVMECGMCLGTGMVKPYYDPVLVWIEMGVDNKSAPITDIGERHPNKKAVRMNGLPRVKPRDLMQDPFTGKIFLVESVNQIGRLYAPVVQLVNIDMQPTQEDVYKYLKITPELMLSLQEQMTAITNERRF